jgi:peptidoglycan/xylan/chitin deacetylase (PgdA/CDA1 family)
LRALGAENKMNRKLIMILPAAFFAVSIAVIYLILWEPLMSKGDIAVNRDRYELRREEIRSRLLAVPILLYHNIDGKGIYSVTSDMLHEHFEYFRAHDIQVVPLSDLISRLENPVPYNTQAVVITFDDGYKSMFDKLLPLANEYHYPITLFVYLESLSDKPGALLTFNELRLLQKGGVDVESHTVTHADLLKLSLIDNDEARLKLYRELYLSKKMLEEILDKPVTMIAFPYGYYNQDVIRMAKLAGYERVFSTEYGSNIITRDNYCLRRHHVKRNYTLNTIEQIIKSN